MNEKANYNKLIAEINSDLQNSTISLFNNYQTLNSIKDLVREYPDLQKKMGITARFVFMMKTNSEKEAVNFLNSEYKNALIPKS